MRISTCLLITGIAIANGSLPLLAQAGLIASDIHWVVPVYGTGEKSVNLDKATRRQVNVSNNNVAISLFQEQLYLAFRTASHHQPAFPAVISHFRPAIVRQFLQEKPHLQNDRSDILLLRSPFANHERLDTGSFKKQMRRLRFAPVKSIRAEIRKLLQPRLLDWYAGDKVAAQYFAGIYPQTVFAEIKKSVRWFKRHFRKGNDRLFLRYMNQKVGHLLWASDFREPIFYQTDDRLYFVFIQVAKADLSFQTLRTWRMQYSPERGWSAPKPFLGKSDHVWDIRRIDNTPAPSHFLLSAYEGGHYSTESNFPKTTVKLFRSDDGKEFRQHSVVYEGGGNEFGFAYDSNNRLWGNIRIDDGDEKRGWGSLTVHSDDHGKTWQVPDAADPARYDSVRMVRLKDKVYAVARQNIGFDKDGRAMTEHNFPYDLSFAGVNMQTGQSNREKLLQAVQDGKIRNKKQPNAAAIKATGCVLFFGCTVKRRYIFDVGIFNFFEMMTYWFRTAKRTTVYAVGDSRSESYRDSGQLEPVLTLPSAGDTAFASVVKLRDDTALIANYSSDVKQGDFTWKDGQFNPSGIYFVLLQEQ